MHVYLSSMFSIVLSTFFETYRLLMCCPCVSAYLCNPEWLEIPLLHAVQICIAQFPRVLPPTPPAPCFDLLPLLPRLSVPLAITNHVDAMSLDCFILGRRQALLSAEVVPAERRVLKGITHCKEFTEGSILKGRLPAEKGAGVHAEIW